MKCLQDVLDNLYKRYNVPDYRTTDPVALVHRFSDARDVEVAGLVASSLAYGSVGAIQKTVGDILAKMDAAPHRFVTQFDECRDGKRFYGFRYRFTTGEHLVTFITLIKKFLERYHTIGRGFLASISRSNGNYKQAMVNFVEDFFDPLGGSANAKGVRYLLPSPSKGSCCKRLNMYLRWMVRKDAVDFGLWNWVAPSNLIMPMDTHIHRISRLLGWIKRRTPSWQTAEAITQRLKSFAPADPVKYDFALSRIGIVEGCREIAGSQCTWCDLRPFCVVWKWRSQWRVT